MTPRRFTLVAVALFAMVWTWLPEFTVTVFSYIGLNSLVALGLVMMTGIAGMTSFGQAAFAAIGAYATAWACTSPVVTGWLAEVAGTAGAGFVPWLGLALGLALTGFTAWVLGAVTQRLSGHYLPLCTIAWGLSLYYLFGNLDFLGGQTGLMGIPPLKVAGASLASPRAMGALIWLLVFAALWGLHNLLDSREGRAIRALKSGRVMAESMGIDTSRYRVKLFVLAALLAGLSGWLYAHLQRFVNATPFGLNVGIEYLFMAVAGGAAHLWGAVLGAAMIALLKEQLQNVLPSLLGTGGNYESIVFGLLMLLVLQRFAQGVWPVMSRACSALYGQTTPEASTSVATWRALVGKLPTRMPTAPGSVILEADGVTKRFGGLVANNAVAITLNAGEVHAVIGPNGAGKSTFFNMISGVDKPTEGIVRLGGVEIQGHPSRAFAERGLSRTFQQVRLLGTRSVLENVALGAHRRARRGWVGAMLRLDRREEAALLAEARLQCERCGLTEHLLKPATSLALGQQRIVEIARALASAPSVLLLDEPAAGLRHMEKQALARLLAQLRVEGLGILLVEHDMEFVMNLADRVTVMEFGAVIAHGTPAQIQQDPVVLGAYLGGIDDELDTARSVAKPAAATASRPAAPAHGVGKPACLAESPQ